MGKNATCRLLCAACICLLLFALLLSSCSSRAEGESAVLSAVLNGSGEKVKVTVYLDESDLAKYQKSTIALFALESFRTEKEVEGGLVTPIAEKGCAKKLTFSCGYTFDHGTRTRLTQRFLVAAENREVLNEKGAPTYTVLTEAVYLSNPEVLAVQGESGVEGATLKGLALDAGFDPTVLSPAQAVLDLYLEEYIALTDTKGETLSTVYMGESVYFHRAALERLDEQMRYFASSGVRVYFRLLIRRPEVLPALVYPGSPAGEYYLPNLQSEDGTLYVSAFLDLLASRYAADSRYARALSGVIPGMAINDRRTASTSLTDFHTYMQNVLALMRTSYNIFRSYSENVQVYLPISSLFTTDGALAPTERDTREFLGAFASYSASSGDFPWAIYLSMQANDESGAIYRESGTVNLPSGVTKKYILPQTLSPLVDLLSTDALRYGGAARQMIWGLTLTGTGERGELIQASSLLYAYKSAERYNASAAKNAPTVAAVIYERCFDTETSFAGLLLPTGKQKSAGRLFAVLDSRALNGYAELSALSGELAARYDEISSLVTRPTVGRDETYAVAGDGTQLDASHKRNLLFGSENGFYDAFFVLPGDGTLSQIRLSYDSNPVLKGSFRGDGGAGMYTGGIPDARLRDVTRLCVTVSVTLPDHMASLPVFVALESTGGTEGVRLVAAGEVKDGEWSSLMLDVDDLPHEKSAEWMLTIYTDPSIAAEAGGVSLYLLGVETVDTKGWFLRGGWALTLLAVLLVALTAFLVWFFYTYSLSRVPIGKTAKGRTRYGFKVKKKMQKHHAQQSRPPLPRREGEQRERAPLPRQPQKPTAETAAPKSAAPAASKPRSTTVGLEEFETFVRRSPAPKREDSPAPKTEDAPTRESEDKGEDAE